MNSVESWLSLVGGLVLCALGMQAILSGKVEPEHDALPLLGADAHVLGALSLVAGICILVVLLIHWRRGRVEW